MQGKFVTEPPAAFVGASGGASLLDLSESTFHAYVASGLLPPPYRLRGRSLWFIPELIDAVRAQPRVTKSEQEGRAAKSGETV